MLSKIIKSIFGTAFLVPGLAFVILETWNAIQANRDAKLIHVAIGFTLILIGGYIIAPVLADYISDEIIEKVNVVDRIKGGRRKTDPPIDDKDEEPTTVIRGE